MGSPLPIIVHVFDYAIYNLINSNKRIYKLGEELKNSPTGAYKDVRDLGEFYYAIRKLINSNKRIYKLGKK